MSVWCKDACKDEYKCIIIEKCTIISDNIMLNDWKMVY